MKVEEADAYASLVIDRFLKTEGAQMAEADRRFFTTLVYTVIEHLPSIDEKIRQASRTPFRKLNAFIKAALRTGICQLMYMEVQSYAAVNETVALVKKSPLRSLAPFVNGVLRQTERNLKETKEERSDLRDLPEALKESFERDYGPEGLKKILEGFSSEKPMCIRINTLKISAEDALKKIEKETKERGGTFRRGTLVKEAVYITRPGDISTWEMFKKGEIYVQDESSMLAASLVEAGSGEKVLDMCSAPGGKSLVMAQSMKNTGEIISRDIHEHRIRLIEENAERMGVTIIRAGQGDASLPLKEDEKAFDRVLMDVPCSGLGILRSKPDIALRAQSRVEESLYELQRKILTAGEKAVKDQGRLIYSTCTLNKKENQDQVRWFLKNFPAWHLCDLEKMVPGLTEEDGMIDDGLTLWPVKESHDGFFVAVFEK